MPARSSRSRLELDRTVTHRLHVLQKLTDRVSQSAYQEKAGMPIGEARCLAAIGAFSPLSVNDLAAHANLDKAQASRAANALLAQGLITKEASAQDGRGVVLALTPDGQARWQRVMAVIRDRNVEVVECLSAEEQRLLDRLLDRLLAHAGALARSI